MEKQSNGLMWTLVVICCLGLLSSGLGYFALAGMSDIKVPTPQITDQDKLDIANGAAQLVIANLPEPVVPVTPVVPEVDSVDTSSDSYILNKEEFEDEATEAKAVELATAELDSRDFKKAVYEALLIAYGCEEVDEEEVCSGVDIDSYKDITEIKVMDSDVDGNEVTFDVKVYYFLDGDEDETQKARLVKFTIVIDNLDFDDDFEDAEVDEDYLDTISVKKVYD